MNRANDPMTQRERRQNDRKFIHAKVQLVLGPHDTISAELVDISTEGALLLLSRPAAVQTPCKVEIELTRGHETSRVEVAATILRCESDRSQPGVIRAAIEFNGIGEPDKDTIRHFGQTLLRQEALAARRETRVGNVILAHPVLFGRLAWTAAAIGPAVVALFIFGSHTRRSTVAGELVPDTGLITVHAQQSGVVSERHVKEGQSVRRGDVLYTLSGERHGSEGAVQATASARLAKRRDSLHDELENTRAVHEGEAQGLARRIDSMRDELGNLGQQIQTQRARLRMAEDLARRYGKLLAQDYVSYEQTQQKQDEMLDQRARLYDLERNRGTLQRELAALETELAGLKLRQSNQLATIERAVTEADQELTESDARRAPVIVAPQDGVIATANASAGQPVSPGMVLASIVPRDSRLEAQLYAPSRAIAFVRPGNKVRIRYQAYPFQKFGMQEGVVTAVSKTALPMSAFMSPETAARHNDEPVYRIRVGLPAQALTAQGAALPLQAGMQLEADLMQERRRLYEWVFQPRADLTGGQ